MSRQRKVSALTAIQSAPRTRNRVVRLKLRRDLEIGSPHWTISATGWGWASRPAKRNENRWDWTECGAGSGEIEINHGAIEAEQLCDPERA